MVNLAMSIYEFLTKFRIFWHPWVCIYSDLKPPFETDVRDSSYCDMYISGSDLNHVALDNSMSQTVCTGQKKPAATKGEIQQL